MSFLRDQAKQLGRPLLVGHRGAAAVAPENTLEAFEAALDAGCDAIEFDVVRALDDTLVVAHSLQELPTALVTLEEALAWLHAAGCRLHVDVKDEGDEDRIVDALERHALVERTLVTTLSAASVRRFGSVCPGLERALSYPDDRLGVSRLPGSAPVLRVGLAALRLALPVRIPRFLAASGASALSLQYALLTQRVASRCRSLGVPVVAWTVNEPARATELAELGVAAIVSDDPGRLAATLFRS